MSRSRGYRPQIARLLDRRREDAGFAMVTVLCTMMVMSIFVYGAFQYALNTLPQANATQDSAAALAAAKAGIDDYVQRLSANTLYWENNGVDSSNDALVNPSDASTANHWRTVPGVSIPSGDSADPAAKVDVPQYQYQVLQSFNDIQSYGLITLQVTGKVGTVERTLLVDLRQESFLTYAYFTNYETFDPKLYDLAGYDSSLASRCAGHYWYSTASDPKGRATVLDSDGNPACPDPAFNSSDTINGPLHSNDALLLKGTPTFKSSQTESSWPTSGVTPVGTASKLYRQKTTTSKPTTCTGCYAPVYADPLVLPSVNLGLQKAADSGQGGKGCLYTGPTKITFQATGGYSVISPGTTSAPSYCGSFSTKSSTTAQTVTGPKNGVIYVQDAATPITFWSGFPASADSTSSDTTFGASTTAGDAYVSGTVKGQYDLAANRNVTVVGSVIYNSGVTGTDVLGLISQNGFVQIYHPVASCSSGDTCINGYSNVSGSLSSPTVDAAIAAENHSFIVQNYNRGAPLGTLKLIGAVIQNYRGPVAQLASTGTAPTSGYAKNYVYDTRLQNSPPPAFINPQNAQWQIQNESEQNNQ